MSKDLDNIIDRIQKLLELSRSDNPHEAGLAASRAQGLMLKYHLSLEEVGTRDTAPKSEIMQALFRLHHSAAGTNDKWRRILLNSTCINNFGKAIRMQDCEIPYYIIVAREIDIEHIKYLYVYLSETIERLCQPYLDYGKDWLDSFCVGAVQSVSETMKEQRLRDLAESESCTALVLRSDKQVAAKFSEFFPDARASRATVRLDKANNVGRVKGRDITINRAMEGHSRGQLS